MDTSETWIDRQFQSAVGKYRITSATNSGYNCIAFAAGSTAEWWSHFPGYKWPAPRSPLIGSLISVFQSLGFEERPSTDLSLDPDFEKVALYAKGGLWKHASRQLPDGKWTSKLGPDEDIEHDTPECFCGDFYGTIHCVMRKARK